MTELIFNVDPVAEMRRLCGGIDPDPAAAAILAELAGAGGVSARVRSGGNGLRLEDIRVLRRIARTKLVLKMEPTPQMTGFALELKPDAAELGGEMDPPGHTAPALVVDQDAVGEIVEILHASGVPASVAIEAAPDQVKLAHRINASSVKIHTGRFRDARNPMKRQLEMDRIVDAAKLARRLGMGVEAGGGLDYNSIRAFRGLSEIGAYHVGRGIAARAALTGMQKAVEDMLKTIRSPQGHF